MAHEINCDGNLRENAGGVVFCDWCRYSRKQDAMSSKTETMVAWHDEARMEKAVSRAVGIVMLSAEDMGEGLVLVGEGVGEGGNLE